MFPSIPFVFHMSPVLDSNDCKQCPKVLAEIEHIDDDADASGINFVKIDDRQMAKEFGVFALPAVLFFKLGSKDPVIYAGILTNRLNSKFDIDLFKCEYFKKLL